ncbi:hypothetical protein Cob_v001402 [Colletotrichum orbiculare MAFF 240422]|uniref:Uncharacterized protein n=1 Tax=Colletotrichum orbiculare (strain 104-T / ATCC 96160 / CBS 514.97 / LARS 414 / MAFF 240422) TaxID=1213857 RepID=A0A484G6B6_COLOR|nr:hypothetical protein Cob_v001402 [Colletotrichum orbiculare MAFF 240422]
MKLSAVTAILVLLVSPGLPQSCNNEQGVCKAGQCHSVNDTSGVGPFQGNFAECQTAQEQAAKETTEKRTVKNLSNRANNRPRPAPAARAGQKTRAGDKTPGGGESPKASGESSKASGESCKDSRKACRESSKASRQQGQNQRGL